MNHKQHQHGFTLVEMLVVMLILGILGTIVFTATRGLMQRQQMAEATSQVAQSLQQLRSSAAKTSRNATFTFNSAKPGQYQLTYWGGGTAPIEQTVSLPHGATLQVSDTTASGIATIEYQAPYGELNVPNRTVTITPSGGNASKAQNIYVVGITGQVHQ